MGEGRGGKRPNAGRKRTAEKYESAIQQAEKRIADRLPELIDGIFDLARGGDYKATAYLIDRVMGKPMQAVEQTGPGGGPLRVIVEYEDSFSAVEGETTEAASGTGEDYS